MAYKKYTPEELEIIFDLDFLQFLKVSAFHKENNPDYFNSVILPFYVKQKSLGKIPENYPSEKKEVKSETTKTNNLSVDKNENMISRNTPTGNAPLHTPSELENISITDPQRFKDLMNYYYENNYEFFENTLLPIMKKQKYRAQNSIEGLKTNNITKSPGSFVNNDLSEELLRYPITNGSLNNVESLVRKEPSENRHLYTANNNLLNAKKSSRRNSKLVFLLIVLSAFVITSFAYYFWVYDNYSNQVNRHLKNKEYLLAYNKLINLDTTSEQFQKIKSKYYYAKGGSELEANKIRNAYYNLLKVDNNDELITDVKVLISKIETDPSLIYRKGIDHLELEEYDLASAEFKKIKSGDNNFNQSQSKLAFINGKLEFNTGNFQNANNLFQQVNKSDEYYPKILELQPQIDEYLSNKADEEMNVTFARFLLRIADEIQDEYQLMTQRSTYDYTKFTYLPKLISLRADINRYAYDVKKKDKDLLEFKKIILSWVNSYIKYGEYIGDYGYKSNYSADRMWYDYGYILRDEKDNGYNLHQKVIKKYKSIKTANNIN